ncbi:MAG: putative two-component system sensor kinase, partial [Candidatus Solibacter sp.]|nr:putative two-component system sensor kinase [Candidatus Solibacter sp.]
FGTPQGLNALDGGKWRAYTTRDGLPADDVNCLLQDSAGVLWAGTGSGLGFRAAERFQSATGGAAALREAILGIAEDRVGWLWIATSNHVLRVKRDALLRGTLHAGDLREYGPADGLHDTEGVKRYRSVAADGMGRIWFSMNRGLSVVDPARLTGSLAPALVRVQSVMADGTVVEIGSDASREIRIPPARQRIAFTFTGLSLSVPERIQFRYRLDSFESDWSAPATVREAVYTNLNPGRYRFRVIASNADGLWNGTEAAVGFQVDALFWQTWWFRLCCAAGCVLAVLGVYRFRLHQLTSRLNVRFEERLEERTRIAKELHDTLLQGFVGASMQLSVAADRLPEDSPVKPPVNRILELMGEAIEEGRHAVRGLRLADNRAEDLAQAFLRLKLEFDAEDEVDFRVTLRGDPRPLHPVVRDEVYRFGREAVAGAFRDARAGRIEMEMEFTRKRLRILVRDNGKNSEPRERQAGMRERAERIGAKLCVGSDSGAGTEVELSVPGNVAYGRRPRTERRK